MELVAFWANIATLVALALNIAGLFFAGYQIRVGRRTSSAGALIALNESFRQAWLQFTSAADDDRKQYAFADVANLLESACAILEDKMFVGRAEDLLTDYLCQIFRLIQNSEDARSRMQGLLQTKTTFSHAERFRKRYRSRIITTASPAIAADVQPAE